VAIVIVKPEFGTVPTNVTVPSAGARIASAVAAATSIPRC
jgi:hypothetical protein